MALPTPNLDDRRFQDLVDEAKRRVQQNCPEWTDHNVSDPGVTLIETFAHMVDELLYRLNRVPELHYLHFLELIGVRLFPPTPARCDVTFWLSAAREETVTVPAGAQVASLHSEAEEPVVFTVERELAIVASRLVQLGTSVGDATPLDRIDELGHGGEVACFATPPAPGDAVLFGLSEAVPGCAVLLRMSCRAEGVGVDPTDPPMVWEAWDGNGWTECEVDHDTTGAFNRDGDVVLHVPASHTAVVLGRHRAGWLRCRLVEPAAHQRFFSASPRLQAVTASTIGGTVPAVHADVVRDETLGLADGVPGQRFPLGHRPVVAAAEPVTVEVAGPDGWQTWREVESFAFSGPSDQHVMLDRMAGELVFGPAVRLPDSSLRHYGAVPAKGAAVRVAEYRTGGGRRGNVAREALQVQRDPVPYLSSVTNRRAATGGVDAESVRDAAARGPLMLRTRDRAVTAEDYEQLTREAAPQVARVQCIAADRPGAAVRVLVVPAVPDPVALEFATLKPDLAMLARITSHLDERRCLGARISVEPPYYRGVTVVARLQARAGAAPETLRTRAIAALYAYLNPVTGGPEGTGWPFGRPVQAGEIFAVLQRLPGIDLVDDVRLFAADPITGERGGAVPRIDLPPHALVFSYGHQVRVDRGS